MAVSKEITIVAPHGLHMRPASDFAKEAKAYKADTKVTLTFNGTTVSATSPIKIVSLSLAKDSVVTLTCDGEREAEALEKLSAFLDGIDY